MASNSSTVPRPAAFRGVGRSILLTLPIALWSLLMFTPTLQHPGRDRIIGGIAVIVFMTALFFLMMRTGETYRWRRIFFVALGFLFPVGFICHRWSRERGTMSIPISRMVSGDTPFCFMVTPSIILPAAFARTIMFPGSILPTATNPRSIATMIGALVCLDPGAWARRGAATRCFFGGIEEGFAGVPEATSPQVSQSIDSRLRLDAVGDSGVRRAAFGGACSEPVYCRWLCPFKTVTEYSPVRNFETAVQMGIFVTLFLGLVVALPLLTRKRTQCSFLCPFGAFQSIFNKIGAFEVRLDRSKCKPCVLCEKACPTLSIGADALESGKPRLSCMKCGACVDSCKKDAAVWHLKGTPVAVKPERARLLFLYGAWGLATMFGGTILAGSLAAIIGFLPWK